MKKIVKAGLLCMTVLLSGCRAPITTDSPAAEPVVDTQTAVTEAPVPETEQEPASEVEREPVIWTVKITAVGDCTLGPTQKQPYSVNFHSYYDKYGENYFFDGVREVFEADDFTLVNLECVLSNSDDRVEKTWNLKGKPEYVGIMTNSSVEGCSLGNNHTFDYGQAGLDETREVLNEAGIVFGFNEHTDIYTTGSGVKIGIVSASQLSADEKHANYIRDGIQELRDKGADLVIASCHWGIEGDHYPNDYQRTLAHNIIDWGADLLIGTHPHVLQGIELYNGKVICYSLGNFCFGGNLNPQVKDTAIYEQTFTFVDGELQTDIMADIIPCRISSTDSRNDFQPTIAEGEKWEKIIKDMNDYSQSYSNIKFDKEGKLTVRESGDAL